MQHKKHILGGIAALALIVPAAAQASGEHAQIAFKPGAFAINKQTCRFLSPEADPGLGSSWAEGKIYAAYEDGRHDALMSCTRARQDRIAACLAVTPPPVYEKFDHGVGNPGDELGLGALRAYLRTQANCVVNATGVGLVAGVHTP